MTNRQPNALFDRHKELKGHHSHTYAGNLDKAPELDVIFIVKDKSLGSAQARAVLVSEALNKRGYVTDVVETADLHKYKRTSRIIVCVGPVPASKEFYLTRPETWQVLIDPADKYLYDKDLMDSGIRRSLYDGMIANNEYMAQFFQDSSHFGGIGIPSQVIYHWSDPALQLVKEAPEISDSKALKFGYMGSVMSLFHTGNFMNFETLKDEFDIIFHDTEVGRDVTKEIKKGEKYDTKTDRLRMLTNGASPLPESIKFNVHINIREIGSDVSKFKPCSKLATAAAFGHNIISTIDESIKDLLPRDYPFLLNSTDIDDVRAMFHKVEEDFNSSKKLWKRGLRMMQDVKKRLEFSHVIDEYEDMLKRIVTNSVLSG